jgi:hypothetical protein
MAFYLTLSSRAGSENHPRRPSDVARVLPKREPPLLFAVRGLDCHSGKTPFLPFPQILSSPRGGDCWSMLLIRGKK